MKKKIIFILAVLYLHSCNLYNPDNTELIRKVIKPIDNEFIKTYSKEKRFLSEYEYGNLLM